MRPGIVLIRRRWPEALYVGLSLLALSTTTWFMSVPRAMLLWWPLWILLARESLRRRWVHSAYLAIAPALMATYVIAFTSGGWVG